MKKYIFMVLILLLVVGVGACSDRTAVKNAGDIHSGGVIELGKEWPENEYTEGVPAAPGTVSSATVDTDRGYCSIFVSDMNDDEYTEYMAALEEAGYATVEEIDEKIEGQDYVAIGTLLSDGKRGISISYIPGMMGIYISTIE